MLRYRHNKEELNMGMIEELKEAIQPYRPAIVEEYKRLVNRIFADMVRDLGPELKNVYNDWNWAISFQQQISPNLVRSKSTSFHEQRKEPKVIDTVSLDKNAEKYADDALSAWFQKIISKVGDLSNIKFSYSPRGFSFTMYGKRGTDDIRIEQNMIVNQSKKHLLFNQFPSRIYVNGKFLSELNYKKMFVK
jgi:hypothetical protein